jgi:hypothetical protein
MGNIIAQIASAGIPSSTTGPAWQPTGCPSWCQVTDLHCDADHYDDRIHIHLGAHVPLSLAPRVDDDTPTLDVSMAAHYRETSPRVWIGRDGTNAGEHLTLGEARQLALQLLELVAAADGSCHGHCCTCGGDGTLGAGVCPVCNGTGSCGCH